MVVHCDAKWCIMVHCRNVAEALQTTEMLPTGLLTILAKSIRQQRYRYYALKVLPIPIPILFKKVLAILLHQYFYRYF